jgi:transposase
METTTEVIARPQRRRQRQTGQLASLTPKKHGRKVEAQAQELARLQRENAELRARLERAERISEAKKRLLLLLNQEIPEVPEPK